MESTSSRSQLLGPAKALRGQVRYTGALAEQAYRLNRIICSLTVAENRQRFRDDPEAYLQDKGLSDTEKQLLLNKDCMGLFDYGVNIYAVAKAGTIMGVPLSDIGTAMRARGAEASSSSKGA